MALSDGVGRVAPPHASATVASVLALDGDHGKLSKADDVFAVYPDTTSFYAAVVSIPPRRAGGAAAVCHCQFQDDQDETGMNPDRAIPLKYVIKAI